ncbi:MAG: polysaccharide biosynthesis protein [Eubacteriales bacterium]|nr:polysaccharide biosynthesis protein [Eubacteriales bacterium]
MGEKNKSNYLVQGTILAAASILARILGMLYRFPLANILTDEGNAYYQTANSIYTILLMISTFSLPLAVSKLVSERINLGQMKNAQKVFRCSMRFALISGGVVALLTFFLAGVICNIMKVENAVYALRVLAPAIFIYAIVGVFRGFFQGHETMVPTAVSQVVEQIIHVIFAVAGAMIMVNYGKSLAGEDPSYAYALGAAGATFGTTVSVAVSLVLLAVLFATFNKKFRRQMAGDPTKRLESDRAIYTAIFLTILPVILSTVIYNITPTLDQAIFNSILAGQGYTPSQYNTIYGIYSGKFYVLMNVPLVLASSLAPSVVPPLSAAMIHGDYRDAKIKVRSVMRYTMIITIPCAVGFLTLGHPIMALVFNDWRQLPAGLMQAGSLMMILFAVSTVSTAVLQGMSRMGEPVKNSAIALVIHIIVLYVFLKNFQLNIYGVVYSNTIFALVVCILNSMAIKRYLHYTQEIRKTFLIPLISATIMGIVDIAIYKIFNALLNTIFIDRFSNAAALILAVLAAIFVYAFLLIRLKGIRESEIADLPKGDLLVRMLRKIRFL